MRHIFTRFMAGQSRHAIARKAADCPDVGVTFCGLHYNLRCSKAGLNGSARVRKCRECLRVIREEGA